MAETRPSGVPIIADNGALVIQELATVDVRGRIHLLPRWATRLTWLRKASGVEVVALMVMVEPGLLSLRGWQPDGAAVVAQIKALSDDTDGIDLEVLRLLQDRYQRLPIPPDRRPHLGDSALHHLGLPTKRGLSSNIYVAIGNDRIDVFSTAYRNARLVERHAVLDDLP